MKCPHCRTSMHHKPALEDIGTDSEGQWIAKTDTCPECKRLIIWLMNAVARRGHNGNITAIVEVHSETLIRPKGALRPPCPKEVPVGLASDYNEACVVIGDSPKASAALSRRCLQSLLRSAANVKPADLSKEIQQVLDSKTLPSYLAESIDAIRNVGNFAAHPIKSERTGEIIEVEPGEAEWNLEVLESLFDFYYVQPTMLKAKRAALDAKLNGAGKPPMK